MLKSFLNITKALSDETRVRALLALRKGELCLCQIIEMLGMAPSTVSKHMDLLYQAGLVQRRKQGRWHYFRLAERESPPAVQQAIRWTFDTLVDEPRIAQDEEQLLSIRNKNLKELSICYRRACCSTERT